MTGITQTVAGFVTDTTFTDLPGSVVNKIKQLLLDSIGCALAGHIVDRTRIGIELVGELGGNPQATIVGKDKTSYALAAFANGELINALDYDAVGPLTPHITPYTIPPCLSMAERVHASGKDLITALAVGYETGGRVASSVAGFMVLKDSPPYFEWSPRFSYTSAIFGAVAAAGKTLNLNNEQILNALGIAGASTPVPAGVKWQHTPGPAIMLKFNCWVGWIAKLAVIAALAAERGFTGDTTILDGEWGYWQIYGSPFFKADNITSGLGKTWHIEEAWFKPFPSCGVNLAGIDGVNRLMQENDIGPEEIEAVLVKGNGQLLTANRSQTEITSFEDAQFSPAAAFALAIYHGRQPGPAWLLPGTFKEPKIAGLMKKIKVAVHPASAAAITSAAREGKLQGFFGATVEITAKGKKYTAEVTHAKGTLDNPMTAEELIAKFRHNASYSALRSDKVERAIETIHNLEQLPDITDLMKLLAVDGY